MEKWVITTKHDSKYELFRIPHWFNPDYWFMIYRGAHALIGGLRKGSHFIPAKKIRSRLSHYVGYQVVFADNTDNKAKDFPTEFWKSGICGKTSEIREVEGPVKHQ